MKINEIETKMKESEYWPNICLATSITEPSCSAGSFASPLVFLPLGGEFGKIEDLTQEQIDAAWDNCISQPAMAWMIEETPSSWPRIFLGRASATLFIMFGFQGQLSPKPTD